MELLVHRRIPARTTRLRTLVFLHGLGDSLHGWSFLPEELDLSEIEVVLVQAPLPYGPGWSWYELDASLRPTPQTSKDIAQSRDRIGQLLDTLNVPLETVILGGFSQGAVLSLETALRGTRPLAGVLAVSGYVPLLADFPAGFSQQATTIPVLATHGPWDNVIPFEFAKSQMLALQELGVSLEFASFDKAHDLDFEEELPRIREFVLNGK